MTLLELVTYAAVTWYISYAVTSTRGPFGIFNKVREFKKGKWHGRMVMYDKHMAYDTGDKVDIVETVLPNGLLDCIVCTAIWVALALWLITGHTLLEAFAVAGIALWAHGFFGWRINM